MTRPHTFFQHGRTIAVVVSLIALIGASIGLAFVAEARHQKQVAQAAAVQAHILADSVSAALAFNDTEAIQQYTGALRANPDILAVGVYDEHGALVASYGLAAELDRRAPPHTITLRAPVVENGVKLGMVVFRQGTETYAARAARYAAAGLLVLMGSLMLTVMALDARKLTAGNRRLIHEMAERERAEAALRQSQKLEAVGRLTGGIAHDFNNMLAIVIGNLDLFMRKYPDAEDKMMRFVSSSHEAAKRAANLTHRLLAFSRRQALDPKATDVGKSVVDTAELLTRTLGDAITIETKRAAGLWRALIDVSQLETALVNLAVNARDAMPNGGSLSIDMVNARLDHADIGQFEDVAPGDYVLVSVTDTGTGMTPEVIAQVFEPFFTTKPVGLGTGLGLSQVHGFIKQSGGHIAIDSAVGRGTTIKLYLPKAIENVDAPVPEVAVSLSDKTKHLTVLVVDDEAGVLEYAVNALGELGYDVISANTSARARQIIETGATIDILLTDVVMPDASGRELADAALAQRPGLPVLYMTGYSQDAIVHNGILDSGTHVIGKPFSIDELDRQLRAMSPVTEARA